MLFEYGAEVVRVVDGDTLDLRVDLGFHTYQVQRFRLLHYDAPEKRAPTLEIAKRAQLRLEQLVTGRRLQLVSSKADDFGRWLCVLWSFDLEDTQCPVQETLIAEGYGRLWNGKGKRLPWDPLQPYPLPGS